MPTIQFETGQKVEFDKQPTIADIEEIASKLGIKKQPESKSLTPGTVQQVSGEPITKRAVTEFGRGILSGVTLGGLGKSELKTPSGINIPRFVGQSIGSIPQIILSEIALGRPIAQLAVKYGYKPVFEVLGQLSAGAGYGVGTQIGEKGVPTTVKELKETGKRAVETGVSFGILNALGKLFGKEIPESIYKPIINQPPTSVLSDINAQTQKLAEKVVEHTNLVGSKNQMLNKTRFHIDRMEKEIELEIEPTAKEEEAAKFNSINTKDVVKGLDEPITNLEETGINQKEAKVLKQSKKDFLNKYPSNMDVRKAQRIKRTINKQITEPQYLKSNQDNPERVQAQRIIANGLKKEIERVVPNIEKLNEEYGTYLETKYALAKGLSKTEGKFIEGYLTPIYEMAATSGARLGQKIAGSSTLTRFGKGATATLIDTLNQDRRKQ